jgi:hypothetical protein
LINLLVYNAKDLIYTCKNIEEPEEAKKLYTRTHGLTDPGEQKDRQYNWNVDKHEYVFGKPDPIEMDGAKKSLRTDFMEANYPKTRIVDKRLEDFRQATSDMVGRGKFKGTLHPDIKEDHVFGCKTIVGENWNVGKCIHGDPEDKNQRHFESDPDLGKSVLHRSKLVTVRPKENPISDKMFGIPSIRYDLNKREKTSICDINVLKYNF